MDVLSPAQLEDRCCTFFAFTLEVEADVVSLVVGGARVRPAPGRAVAQPIAPGGKLPGQGSGSRPRARS